QLTSQLFALGVCLCDAFA
ncbi:DUF645 family protein, partial [Vibrio cholerae]